jgi:hypothetical protein
MSTLRIQQCAASQSWEAEVDLTIAASAQATAQATARALRVGA